MFKYLKEYRFYIFLLAFVLIPVLSIDTASRSPREYAFHDRVIVALTSPVQAGISWFLDSVVSGFQNYILLLDTRQQNLALMDENRSLQNTIVNLRETEQENVRLRNILEFKETFSLNAVVARVIAKDISTEFRAIRINRGANAGLRKDMAVVNNEGVVGRVLRTTANTADVVTVLDLLSAVDVIDRRSRVRGIVEGMTDEVCQLKFALRTDDIQVSDVLVSSGLGGVLPKGVPVGTVSQVDRKPYGITQAVEVRPAVNFSKLEEVLVLTRTETTPIHLLGRDGKPVDEKAKPKGKAAGGA
ncbi:MAG TPA: rod shape-determining protein MreC [Bdellovibrionota bacterium]|nr:rod shape-determining protein MreC [Bdellovibrionota bacterium]